MSRNATPNPNREPLIPPEVDPSVVPGKEKRDPLPPSRPDVYPEEPTNPTSPSPEF